MKVLKDNYKKTDIVNENVKPYPRKMICEQCSSELEYEESDLRIGALGCVYVDCPLCHHDNMIENHENEIILTMNNVEYPTHFFHTSKENAVDCCNNTEIKKRIKDAINYFRKNKDEFVWTTESGNLIITVFRYEGDEDYYVTLSNNYYSTYISFESEDYKKVLP